MCAAQRFNAIDWCACCVHIDLMMRALLIFFFISTFQMTIIKINRLINMRIVWLSFEFSSLIHQFLSAIPKFDDLSLVTIDIFIGVMHIALSLFSAYFFLSLDCYCYYNLFCEKTKHFFIRPKIVSKKAPQNEKTVKLAMQTINSIVNKLEWGDGE